MRRDTTRRQTPRVLSRRNVCVCFFLVITLWAALTLVTRAWGRAPPSVRVEEPTHAQRLHTEEESRLNQDLIAAMERNGLSQQAARLREKPLRFRVFTVETRLNLDLCQVAATASLTGVHVPVVAHDRKPDYIGRFAYMLEYIEEEKLSDDDILYVHDSDVLYVGEDLIPHLVEFGLHSPPSPAELDVAAVRAYDDYGEAKAPDVLAALRNTSREAHTYHASAMRFGLSWSCMSWSAIPMLDCRTAHSYMLSTVEAARNRNDVRTMNRSVPAAVFEDGSGGLVSYMNARLARGMTVYDALNNFIALPEFRTTTVLPNASQLPPAPKFGEDERLRFRPNYIGELESVYLNAGVFTARVWALRQVARALLTLRRTHVNLITFKHETESWWCDQSIFGMLHMLTRTWEAEQGLLHSAAPHQRAAFPENPNGLLPGVLGIETYTKTVVDADLQPGPTPKGNEFSAYLTRVVNRSNTYYLATARDRGLEGHYDAFKSQLRRTRGGAYVAPPLLAPPRTANDDILERPTHCATPDRCPILLHFPGGWKRERMRSLFPSTELIFPALVDPEAATVMKRILDDTLIELHTSSGRVYKRYYDVCTSPR